MMNSSAAEPGQPASVAAFAPDIEQNMTAAEGDGDVDEANNNEIHDDASVSGSNLNSDSDEDSESNASRNRWTKERSPTNDENVEIGAVQVDQRAPQIIRRFYLGLTRPSVIARRREERRERRRRDKGGGNDDTNEVVLEAEATNSSPARAQRSSLRERVSMMNILSGSEVLVSATLVDGNEGEVVEATPVSFLERKWKRIALGTIVVLLLGMVVSIPVLLTQNKKNSQDHIVGTSDVMPASSNDGDYRMCMGGECPIGSLFTDALRLKTGVDFAVMSSGGLGGPGWPAGEVRMSDIRAAYPFENYPCTGVMNGVSVLRLLNYSTASATFESSLTETGGALLQLSGMNISYNTLLHGTGHGRLISVDVWDDDSKQYLPLEHGKTYTFATTNWVCDHKDPYPSLFKTMGMEGEVPGSVDESIEIRNLVGEYLTSLGEAYNTTLRGSHVNDTEAFEPMSFPTLDVVQERGHIRCGVGARTIESLEHRLDLCRAVAAVIFGDPDKYVRVEVKGANRFQQLHERFIDILLLGDTYTIEREVHERTTNVGFAFSAPYYYDGMSYFGNETFVKCAEDEKRYDECTDLRICAIEGTTGKEFVEFTFPTDFILITSSRDESLDMLLVGNCNVIANDRSPLLDFLSRIEDGNDKFVLGDKLMTKEPLAAVTRSNDQTFSDVVNWVVQALFYGEEKGLTKDLEPL